MKKISNISIAAFMSGLVLALYSGFRYFVLYPDIDKAFMYPIIGILLMGWAFHYDKIKKLTYEVDGMGEYLQDKR